MTKTMAANTNTNPMRNIEVEKVVINMGVGESGEKLAKAEKLLERIASQKPIGLHAKRSLQPLGIKKGEAIACKVTLRKGRAKEFLKRCFKIQDKLFASQFDAYGNFSFGIAEHTDFGIRYDPKVGIYGMDVSVSLKRPGYRIKERKIQKRKVPNKQRISKEEGMAFLEKEYGVEVVEE
ncbi:MAG: 50S ribosomal protein L5 [Methanophagales archaeon]|nr:50S ribosomal protein L5 [Methanophagales archaeon]